MVIARPRLDDWATTRVAEIEFPLTTPADGVGGASATNDFVNYLSTESRRILEGGDLSSGFFDASRELYDQSLSQCQAAIKEFLVYMHQRIMDTQFAVTSEWLFLGESVSERPEYHPRYELHTLKGWVLRAAREMREQGYIHEVTAATLRTRLVGMRRNISRTLKMAAYGKGDIADLPLTEVVSVIRESVSQVIGDEGRQESGTVIVNVVSPPSLMARVDRVSLQSALFNLLVNALEAVLGGGVQPVININVESVDIEQEEWVIINLSNQYNPAAPPKPQGTGIGLVDTKFHIEEMSGGLFSTSSEKNGYFIAKIQLRK